MQASGLSKSGASGKVQEKRPEKNPLMKTSDVYLSFVQWSQADRAYVGYCPDLFPAGGVCHSATAVKAFKRLYEIMEDTVATARAKRRKLPVSRTRPAACGGLSGAELPRVHGGGNCPA